jgi:hypothetical protein
VPTSGLVPDVSAKRNQSLDPIWWVPTPWHGLLDKLPGRPDNQRERASMPLGLAQRRLVLRRRRRSLIYDRKAFRQPEQFRIRIGQSQIRYRKGLGSDSRVRPLGE